MTLSRTGPATAPAGGQDTRLSREILVLSAVVILGTIMTVLDLTIVNVAIPTLVGDLHASIDSVQWVLTGYLLAFATVIPLTGWAAGRFGAKRVWLTALGLFLAGSVLAAAAWSIGSLIAFRVLQGFGAGLILPVGQTILAQAAGPQRMGRVMSVIGVPLLLAPVFGPVLGGAILGAASWRWIFLLNLPVGVAAVLSAWRLLPDARPQLGQRLDVCGLVLLCPGIAVFLYGLSEAGTHGGFGSLGTAVATLAGMVLIGLYIWHAAVAGQAALIDLSLLRHRGFAAAAALNFLLPVALFGSLILIPLYYQVIRHASRRRPGCCWPRRASARRWPCRWPACSPTGSAPAGCARRACCWHCWARSATPSSARTPRTPTWAPRCSCWAPGSAARSPRPWPPRSRPCSRPRCPGRPAR